MSGCCVFLCFKAADNAYLCLFSLWVVFVYSCILRLLTMLFIGAGESEWWLHLAMFQAFWQCLSLTLQTVSSFCVLLCLMPDADACPWLSRQWVLCLIAFQACWWFPPLTCQKVSDCCSLLCFNLADDAFPWLSSLWVATASCCALSLLLMLVLDSLESEFYATSLFKPAEILLFGSPEGEWLLCIAAFHTC